MLPFARVTIIGLGLIGSSIARAVQQHMPSVRVTGHDRDPAVRNTAIRIGLCDDIADTAGTAVIDADLVILCVPVGAMGEARVADSSAKSAANGPELYVEFRKDGKPVDPAPWWAERPSGRTGNGT